MTSFFKTANIKLLAVDIGAFFHQLAAQYSKNLIFIEAVSAYSYCCYLVDL
jgi:hypothetical protein